MITAKIETFARGGAFDGRWGFYTKRFRKRGCFSLRGGAFGREVVLLWQRGGAFDSTKIAERGAYEVVVLLCAPFWKEGVF